ncbi:hypothetical protein DFH27DRAFT_643778 [Peziza echinospora]|nr:hypothetical protein DFH27DRAFT_643778 [Peziza echinospora]
MIPCKFLRGVGLCHCFDDEESITNLNEQYLQKQPMQQIGATPGLSRLSISQPPSPEDNSPNTSFDYSNSDSTETSQTEEYFRAHWESKSGYLPTHKPVPRIREAIISTPPPRMAPLPSAGNNSVLLKESLVSGQDDPFIDYPSGRNSTRPDSPYPNGTNSSDSEDTPRPQNKVWSTSPEQLITPTRVGKFLLGKLQKAGAAVKDAMPGTFEGKGDTKRRKLSEESNETTPKPAARN